MRNDDARRRSPPSCTSRSRASVLTPLMVTRKTTNAERHAAGHVHGVDPEDRRGGRRYRHRAHPHQPRPRQRRLPARQVRRHRRRRRTTRRECASEIASRLLTDCHGRRSTGSSCSNGAHASIHAHVAGECRDGRRACARATIGRLADERRRRRDRGCCDRPASATVPTWVELPGRTSRSLPAPRCCGRNGPS